MSEHERAAPEGASSRAGGQSQEGGGDGEGRRFALAQRRAVRRKASGAAGGAAIPGGGGVPLGAETRERMEPGTKEGDQLIAHELTHVVQGQRSGIQRKADEGDEAEADEADVSQPDDPAEKEADEVAEKVAGDEQEGDEREAADEKPAPISAKLEGVARKEVKAGAAATEEETAEASDRVAAAIKKFTQQKEWPAGGAYPTPPKDYNEMIAWTKMGGFTKEQKDYLYSMCSMYGLFSLLNEIKEGEDKGAPVDPRRSTAAGFALSMVGMVEAHTDSGEREDGGVLDGGKVQKCVGADYLWEFHQRAGRKGMWNGKDVKDHRMRTDRAWKGQEGMKRGSWCQIFSQWAVAMAGGDMSLGGFDTKRTPEPGDIAYMSEKDHMAIVVSVEGDSVTTCDGNTGEASAIHVMTRQKSEWNHGFKNAFPDGEAKDK